MIAFALVLSVAVAEQKPNAVVIEEAVLTAPRADVESVLIDVQSWPALFRDIERVDDVRVVEGVVYGKVTSSATGLKHDVEVKRDGNGISWRVDENKGFVIFDVVELEEQGRTSTHLVVRARTHIYGAVKVVLSDAEIEQKLRAVVQADVADLKRKFGVSERSASNEPEPP